MNDAIDQRLDDIIDALYRVSIKLLIVQDHTLLLTKEAEGWYGIPGGGVEHGQTLHQALLRELDEELGITSINEKDISPQPIIVSNAGVVAGIPRMTLYYTTSTALTPQNNELGFKWTSLDELRTITLGPNIASVREELIDYLQKTALSTQS